MPGLDQLKKFTTDILNLGDEVKIRAARGEKPVTVPIPRDISIEDDSEDFRLGMPQLSEEEEQQAQALAEERNREANDFSEITGESSDSDEAAPVDTTTMVMPDVSDLLAGMSGSSLDEFDLSEFQDEEEEVEEEEEPAETPIEDLELDALLATAKPASDTQSSASDDDEEDYFGFSAFDGIQTTPKASESVTSNRINPHKMTHEPSMDDIDFDALMSQASQPAESIGTVESFEDIIPDPIEEASENLASADFAAPEDSPFDALDSDFDVPGATQTIDMNEGIPEEFNETPSVMESSPADDASLDDSMPDFSDDGLALGTGMDVSATETKPTISLEDDDVTAPEGESSPSLDGTETPDFNNDEPLETYDTSMMEGMDFSAPGAMSMGPEDMFSGMETSDEDFEIPNFTGPATDGDDFSKKKESLSTPDFSEAEEDEKNKPKNTFTEAEYRLFRRNLSEYPLNLRLAIENMVVNNEFTDDSIYAVLEKVLRKVPARQLAAHLDKELDIHVDVPRDYERRTVEEYELYKQSLEYKLKNRIIPFAIISTAAAILIFCIGYLSWNFVWNPLRAEHFYKLGYAQIQENLYPQSEDSFATAVHHKPKKKWFYRYAERYIAHHQYERAENVYKSALFRFDHDKKAGLDWARMEQEELYAYAKSAEILKRQVLDFHTNDPDAVLQLGDLYLEWADEEDPTKYADAKQQYDMLVLSKAKKNELYLYNSREMRYYVHVDDLEKVLQYKAGFYPDNMKGLDSRDLTELSGYLLDKRYGTLRPSEEHLRSGISDVKDLLERAVRKDPENPTALYNMGRYSIVTSSLKNAESMLKASIDAFDAKPSRNKKETRTFIDAYRLLGEQYVEQQEYILAQQTYNNGIDLFEKENVTGAFDGTPEVGSLYADLGDINYYVNGDMEAALDNYKQAVKNKNDCAPVRYKIGYIDYINRDYDDAWESFENGNELSNGKDIHTLLALANTLSIKNDYYAAQGYYQDLLDILREDFAKYDVVMPLVRSDHADMVDTYMKATNNIGVALSRTANQNGDSQAVGDAFVNFSESSRAWDSLSRNPETMLRVTTKNLASQNSTYLANPNYGYEPTIYTDIPKSMYGEETLKLK